MNMTILVTGSSGFIGKHTLSYLRGCGLCFITRHVEVGKPVQTDDDVTSLLYLTWANTWSNSKSDADINLDIVDTMLKSARKMKKLDRIVLASSMSVYGRAAGAISETSALACEDEYARCKAASEELFSDFCSRRGISLTVLRYSSVYGPGQKGGFIANVFDAMRSGKALEIDDCYSDFVYVDDVVRANLLALQSDGSGVFNIGSGVPTKRSQAARMVAYLFGNDLQIAVVRGSDRTYCADISLAKKRLGYVPYVPLKEGLYKTVAPNATSMP